MGAARLVHAGRQLLEAAPGFAFRHPVLCRDRCGLFIDQQPGLHKQHSCGQSRGALCGSQARGSLLGLRDYAGYGRWPRYRRARRRHRSHHTDLRPGANIPIKLPIAAGAGFAPFARKAALERGLAVLQLSRTVRPRVLLPGLSREHGLYQRDVGVSSLASAPDRDT